MELLLSVILSALLVPVFKLVLHLCSFGFDRVQRWQEEDVPAAVDPFALQLVQQRLDVLAGELARLERDETVFAKAFHTRAVEDAYAGLLAESARLAAAYRDGGRAPGITAVEIELPGEPHPAHEELRV